MILIVGCGDLKNPNSYRLIAEYEPTEYVWIPWMEGVIDKSMPPADPLIIELCKEVIPYSKILILIPDESIIEIIKSRFIQEGIDTTRVRFLKADPPGATTDISPLFLTNEKGELATVDFDWACYGLTSSKEECAKFSDTNIDVKLAESLSIPVIDKSNLVWEGGGKENNSKGTLLLVEQHEFQRNPDFSKDSIEKEYKRKLNLKKIIWLKKGLLEDEYRVELPGNIWPIGAGAHIDEFCRFVNDSTIMISYVPEEEKDKDLITAENYKRMEENYLILKNATDQNGKPFSIIRVPMPEHYIFQMKYEDIISYNRSYFPKANKGDTINIIAASSYLNFLIVNDAVITAKYWREGREEAKKIKDKQVFDIFSKAFPDKKIIQIDMEGYNNGGGGLHCLTYNQPFGATF
ncbi:agmatine deiminase family protein [Algoriphagus pacificus]|uniref:Agmatine deiminase family protein n=1 Tax=Algoriphagus pacificus TaxID=2811234 RepID=A0ABS3CG14_9BACT|nr:agmatine deiminase family protein [Algoriphagus pacificus]MBN7814584.1 agmatine deiminase family protein [Algoriphagus pacificus]